MVFPDTFTITISFAAVQAIPIGLPVLIVIGGWMYMEGRKVEAGDEEDEVEGKLGKVL